MADVNEEIIEQYFKIVKHWFYVTDVQFKVKRGYSNIDVLAYNQQSDSYYDIEVKYRSAASITDNGESIKYLTRQFIDYKESRDKRIAEYIGKKNLSKVAKVVITTYQMMGKSAKKREKLESEFKQILKKAKFKLPAEIWYFDDIIPELVKSVPVKGKQNTQLLQTIRMLKAYGLVNKPYL